MTWRNNGRRISQPKVGWREVSSTGSQKTWENIVVIHFVGALHPSAPLCSGRLYVHHQNEAINPGGSAGVKHFDLKTDALHQNTRILLGKFRAIAIEHVNVHFRVKNLTWICHFGLEKSDSKRKLLRAQKRMIYRIEFRDHALHYAKKHHIWPGACFSFNDLVDDVLWAKCTLTMIFIFMHTC